MKPEFDEQGMIKVSPEFQKQREENKRLQRIVAGDYINMDGGGYFKFY